MMRYVVRYCIIVVLPSVLLISCAQKLNTDPASEFPPETLSERGIKNITVFTRSETDTNWIKTGVYELNRNGQIVLTYGKGFGSGQELVPVSSISYTSNGRKDCSFNHFTKNTYTFTYADTGRNYSLAVTDSAGKLISFDEVEFGTGYRSVKYFDSKGVLLRQQKFAEVSAGFPAEDITSSAIAWQFDGRGKVLRINRKNRDGKIQLVHLYYYKDLLMARVSATLSAQEGKRVLFTKFVYE